MTLNPLDGRYQKQMAALVKVCGPTAFASARVRAEVAWLLTLAELKLPNFPAFSTKELAMLAHLPELTQADLQLLDTIEYKGYAGRAATNHDVKAVEYFVADRLGPRRAPWVHFALTSEDINSAAYAQILTDAMSQVILPVLTKLCKQLQQCARRYARAVMLARTHGQPAVPTTFGREIKVFQLRLARQIEQLKKQQISCKAGGAIGAYNAHLAAFSKVDWPRAARAWVARLNKGRKNKIFLTTLSTQIDNRDSYAEFFDTLRRINIILLGLSQDMWRYISAGLVKQKPVAGEVGSSTMPQKINPIDFENAEGNLGLANALLTFLSEKLPLSRLQRDLSDSTVLRDIPVALGHCVLAYQNVLKGFTKTAFHAAAAQEELVSHPEVLAEAYQTILRAAGVHNAYEKVKALVRGRCVTQKEWEQFVSQLKLNKDITQKLLAIGIDTYTGLSVQQAKGEK